jgi:predicted aspartyl protease
MARAVWLSTTLLAGLSVSIASEALGGDVVPLRLVRGRLPVVSVRVEGRGPFDFLLDTGTTATVLRSDLAESLEIPIVAAAPVGTAGGDRVLLRAARTTVSLGSVRRAVAPLVSRLETLVRVDEGIRGILGLDWLSSCNYLLDYEGRRLVLDDRDEGEGPREPRVPFRLDRRRILVPVHPHRPAEDAVWLVLDTGAEGVVLTERSGFAVERNPRAPLKLSSAGGTRIARTGSVRRLHAGAVLLRDVPVTLLPDASELGGAEGLLPGRLFRRLYVNHREGYVVFDPGG